MTPNGVHCQGQGCLLGDDVIITEMYVWGTMVQYYGQPIDLHITWHWVRNTLSHSLNYITLILCNTTFNLVYMLNVKQRHSSWLCQFEILCLTIFAVLNILMQNTCLDQLNIQFRSYIIHLKSNVKKGMLPLCSRLQSAEYNLLTQIAFTHVYALVTIN